jgi:hypothetical protein
VEGREGPGHTVARESPQQIGIVRDVDIVVVVEPGVVENREKDGDRERAQRDTERDLQAERRAAGDLRYGHGGIQSGL